MKALFHQQGLTIVKRMSRQLLGVKISTNRSTYQHTIKFQNSYVFNIFKRLILSFEFIQNLLHFTACCRE